MALGRKKKKKEDEIQPIMIQEAIQPLDFLSELTSQEEATAKVTGLLADESRKEFITDLDAYEIKLISSLLSTSNKYKLDFLDGFLKNFMLLRISLNRLGRREIIELATRQAQIQEQGLKRRLGRLIGRSAM